MDAGLLRDAFAHHTWATLRVLDACAALPPGDLDTAVPGTYGSILDTLRHLVAGDASYLNVLTGGEVPRLDEEGLDVAALRAATEVHGRAWQEVLGRDLDPALVLSRHRDDGSSLHAPVSIRLAQALDHGTDHRSQVCTALTSLGVEPPEIDAWAYGFATGSVVEDPPA